MLSLIRPPCEIGGRRRMSVDRMTKPSPAGVAAAKTALALALLLQADDVRGADALLAPLSREEIAGVARNAAIMIISVSALVCGEDLAEDLARQALAGLVDRDAR